MTLEDEIMNLLILGEYSYAEVAKKFEMTVTEIKNIYRKNMEV